MSKQGCKTLRKMFVFMALFPPLRALPPVSSVPSIRAPRESHSHAPFLPCLLATAQIFFSASLPPSFRRARVVLTSSPRCPSPPPPSSSSSTSSSSSSSVAPCVLLRHPHSIAPLRVRSGAPPPMGAHSGAIAPTAAGTTLMLH